MQFAIVTFPAAGSGHILSLCAGNVEQAINRAINFAIQFAGSGDAIVELSKKYEIALLDSQGISALMAAVQSGNMRLVDFIRYQQNVGLAPADKSPEEIETELAETAPGMGTYISGNVTP